MYKKLDRSDRAGKKGRERKGRLEVRHRAQGAVRSEMADKTALLLCLPLSFPLPSSPCPSCCQSQIDSGKDMENYESVGVEQIALDIVES